jgi:EAL domain-containing protein (putative c-di-GMP-specific phosphodiesterase class I)
VRFKKVGDSYKCVQHEGGNRALTICANVQAALRQRRLFFAFQPVVCAATGRIEYFECLLRMRSLEGSIVSGGEFITAIEQSGRIGFIDDYVLEQTVTELAKHPGIRLGLNVSSLTAREGAWLKSLISLAHDRPGLVGRLVVEITETAALSDIEETAHFVRALRKAGCQVAIDDFGAGHTSFQHLHTLAVDIVKIDGSFVRDLAISLEKRLLLRRLLSAINDFGVMTVAEGVENADDEAVVREEGCRYLQGYHLGRPTIEPAWLRKTPANTAALNRIAPYGGEFNGTWC